MMKMTEAEIIAATEAALEATAEAMAEAMVARKVAALKAPESLTKANQITGTRLGARSKGGMRRKSKWIGSWAMRGRSTVGRRSHQAVESIWADEKSPSS